MTAIINLRQAKKLRDRAEKRAAGDENAARFGRSKGQKNLEKARTDKERADLDSHKRQDDRAVTAPRGTPPNR